jgi:processive 1,2-diacylglycerol beta-glucosyltransferase
MDDGLVPAIRAARRHGATIIPAHPRDHAAVPGETATRLTRRYWHELEELRPLVDRYELFNHRLLFGWVADRGLPAVAAGDFHTDEDLASWKTLLLCDKQEQAVLARLRGPDRVYLTPFSPAETAAIRAA